METKPAPPRRLAPLAAIALPGVAAMALLFVVRGAPSGELSDSDVMAIVTAPPGVPTPHEFGSGQEVIDYVLAMLEITEPPVEAYAGRAHERDIMLMKGGPGARIVTPNPTIIRDPLLLATPPLGQVVWIVGLHTFSGVPHWKLTQLVGISADAEGPGLAESSEFAVVVDDIGNVLQSETLDVEHEDGRRVHTAVWQLSDIQHLPTPGSGEGASE